MTDQTIPADKVREILDEWERIKEYADWENMDNLVQDVRALLPAPPRPTLADMTEGERRECRLMQADVGGEETRPVIVNPFWEEGRTRVMWPGGFLEEADWDRVTPRPDLPRMEWPGDKKPDPAPALPDGWRLADHPVYGRVMVTSPAPDRDGYLWGFRPDDTREGADRTRYKPDKLTYIDTEPEEA